MEILVVYSTFSSIDSAQEICSKLMELKLIACFNLMSAKSNYIWQGNLCKEDETIAIMKSKIDNQHSIESKLNELHPYDVPCILSWKVHANETYAMWVEECCDYQRK